MENIGLHKNKHSLGKEMKAVPLLLALLLLTGCAHKEIRMYEPGKTPTTILDSVVVMSKPVRLTYTNEKRKVQKNVRGFLKKQENGFYQFEPRKFGETKPSR
ncbi:hypothetical protein K1X84_09845, partial [bacterium]|nr:hypothetical protein [bacterium]